MQRHRGQQLDEAARRALAAFEQEQRAKRIRNVFGYALVLAAGLMLFLYLGGDYSRNVLGWLGIAPLSNDATGLYADCRRPENRGKGFCAGQVERAVQDWSAIEKKASQPFGL